VVVMANGQSGLRGGAGVVIDRLPGSFLTLGWQSLCPGL